VAVAPHERPIRLVVRDDSLERSRLTVFFRLILAIPLIIWLVLWGIAAFAVAFVLWLAVLINREAPRNLHDFVAAYLRFSTHFGAYIFLAADPYPWFRGRPGYPVDLEIDPPEQQGRWGGFFRLFLALPALLLAAALGGGVSSGSPSSASSASGSDGAVYYGAATIGGVATAVALLAWFVIVVRGRAPRGFRDLAAYALGYGAQATGYLLLLTPRYPSSDPKLAEEYSELPQHPVRLDVEGGLEQSRLTVFFRLLLAIPHFIWLFLWGIVVWFAVVIAWFVALVIGRVPDALHRFIAAYIRYATHVFAFVHLVGRRFPGFTGQVHSYEIDLDIAPAARQNRWKTLFRLFLGIPAFIVASALGGVLLILAFLGWWYTLVTGHMPEGLRNLGASCLRYEAQTYAYAMLATDRYPYGAPVLRGKPEPAQLAFDEALPPTVGDAS
jgi:Domain of unknown function (DUF4389)